MGVYEQISDPQYDSAGHKQLKVLSNNDFSGIHLTKPHQ